MDALTNWIGIVLQTAAIIGSLGWFIIKLHLGVNLMNQVQKQTKEKIAEIDDRVKQLSQVLVDLAQQDQRIKNLEARVQELSNRLFDYTRRDAK